MTYIGNTRRRVSRPLRSQAEAVETAAGDLGEQRWGEVAAKMASWAWFLAGFVAGVITYVGAGNGIRFVWSRFARLRAERPRQPDMYVGDPRRRRVVHFSRQEEAGDEVVGSVSRRSEEAGDEVLGSVVVLDVDDDDFIYEFGWMRRADAIELARELRHRFSEEPIAQPRPSSLSRASRTHR